MKISFNLPCVLLFRRWDFRTDGHDIRFGVTLKDEEGVESPAVKHRRVPSHQMDESGVLACQVPATCEYLVQTL